MKRHRILYLSNSGSVGGMEQHLLDLVEGMVGKGYKVYVICPRGEMTKSYIKAGARVKIDRPRLDVDPLYISRLIMFMRRHKIDILHAHQLKTVINGLIAGKMAGVPLKIAHIHTPLSQWQVSPLKKRVNIFVNRVVTALCADKVIALTEAAKRERIRAEGIDARKIVVIPNGVDLQKLKTQRAKRKTSAQSSKLAVGTLGRLTVEKNQRCFLDAVPYFVSSLSRSLEFVVAGEGGRRSELERRVRELGIKGRVKFLGFVPEERKFEILSSFDIFVFPSLAEGFGIALIEAMALGLPCVVSDLPVLREVTGGDCCALLFKAGNSKDLAAKLSRLIEDKHLRQRLGQKARERVEKKYSMEKFVENYHRLYQI